MSEAAPVTDFFSPESFDLFTPIEDWEKAEGEDGELYVGGFVSDEEQDRDKQKVIQKGLDFNDYVKYGYLNDNHSKDMVGGAVVGVPDPKTPVTWLEKGDKSPLSGIPVQRDGWYIKGQLLKKLQRARDIYDLGKALEDTPHRRLGFSLQGKILRQTKKKDTIMKAMVRHVAITHTPSNPRQAAQFLMKSFDDTEHAYRAHIAGDGVVMETPDDAEDVGKAMTAGGSVNASGAKVAGDGFAYRTESMEPKARTTDIEDDGHTTEEQTDDEEQKKANGLVGYDKCVDMTRSRFSTLPDEQIEAIATKIFRMHQRGDGNARREENP